MRVSTLVSMNCPRCAAPVKGDYKYCPECACRLRPEAREPDPETSSRGPVVVVVSGILLVLAGILVGWKILAGGPSEVRVVIEPPARQLLRVPDIHDALMSVPQGIVFYDRNDEVLTVPPEAFERMVRRVPVNERQAFLDAVLHDPARLGRWGALLSLLHERSEDTLWTRTREEPVSVHAFQAMRYEVTRGQYKQFLLAVEKDPTLLTRLTWVRQLWWGDDGSPIVYDPDPEIRRQQEAQVRYQLYYARTYREDWWNAVLEHHRRRDVARRERLTTEAFETGALELAADANGEEISPAERKRRMRELGDEAFPAAEPPPRPAWLGPTSTEITRDEMRVMTDAEAVLLLVPPGWIRFNEDGSYKKWSSDASDDNLPITDVCWWDARMFITWARKITGINRLRLPTWAEWTRAAHGGNATREPDDFNPERLEGYSWPWGSRVDIHGCNNRNFILNEKTPQLRDVQETYSWHGGRSVEGLLSMAGNAAEWTTNIARNLRIDDEGRLFVGRSEAEEAGAEQALVCGGSFNDGLDDCRVTSRTSLFKTQRKDWVGFRLVTDSGF